MVWFFIIITTITYASHAADNVTITVKAFMDAAFKGDKKVVKTYLEQHMYDRARADIKDENGATALMWAAAGDRSKIVEMLLLHGANKDYQRENDKMTPLHYAVLADGAKALRVLLCVGVNPNVADMHGYTPLMHATKVGKEAMGCKKKVTLLIDFGAYPTLVIPNRGVFLIPNSKLVDYINQRAKEKEN